jgi:hypothetical protein
MLVSAPAFVRWLDTGLTISPLAQRAQPLPVETSVEAPADAPEERGAESVDLQWPPHAATTSDEEEVGAATPLLLRRSLNQVRRSCRRRKGGSRHPSEAPEFSAARRSARLGRERRQRRSTRAPRRPGDPIPHGRGHSRPDLDQATLILPMYFMLTAGPFSLPCSRSSRSSRCYCEGVTPKTPSTRGRLSSSCRRRRTRTSRLALRTNTRISVRRSLWTWSSLSELALGAAAETRIVGARPRLQIDSGVGGPRDRCRGAGLVYHLCDRWPLSTVAVSD